MFGYIQGTLMPTTRSSGGPKATAGESRNLPQQMKGYKITDNERSKKYGIGANSLKMLKDKAKLKFPIKDLRIHLSIDGFEVSDEDYFQTLPAQCLLIVSELNAVITTDADFEFEKLRQCSPLLKVADIFYDFIEKHPEKFRRMIAEYERQRQRTVFDNAKTHLSLKSEHHEWFEGQEERYDSKEAAMTVRAQTRIRGYYYKTKEELTGNKLYRHNAQARQIINSMLEKFRYLLIGCDYFSMIFDRKCDKKHTFLQTINGNEELDAVGVPNKRLRQVIKDYAAHNKILDEWSVSLCSDLGDFYCQGTYSDNGNCCTMQHTINPYASRENLILFQVWNLDHQIELSRTILPAIIEQVRKLVTQLHPKCPLHHKRAVDVSVLEYFLEIFSLKNLKLVHIVCHEKVQRRNCSNGRLICDQCHEFKIVQELMDVNCPEQVDAC